MRQETTPQPQEASFSLSRLKLPPAAMTATLLLYLLLSVGLAIAMAQPLLFPAIGLIGAIAINMIVLLFVRSEFVLPIYLLVAGPSVALSLSSSGILSRLYIGNMMFFLVTIIWLLLRLLPQRTAKEPLLPRALLLPILSLIAIGLISILYSHFFPDPQVIYAFPHSNTSVYVTNAAEIMLLIGLPMFLVVVPGVVRSMKHVQWTIIAYTAIGLLYALGTIFAAPLGLYSQEVILGVRRPQVFGEVSSALGTLLVLFTCITFTQAIYAPSIVKRTLWGSITAIFALGVIMTFGRESWIGLFLALLAMIVIYTKNWKILILALILPIFVLLIPGVTDFFDPSKTYGADRLKIWQDAITIWLHSPIMGTGAGNYQFFDDAFGTDVVGVAHNQYLQMLAETGVQGLVCMLWAMGAVGWLCLRIFKNATTRLGKAVSLSYLGFFVATLFAGLFTSSFIPSAADGGGTAAFVSESYRWLLLGLALSVPRLERQAQQEAAQKAESPQPAYEPPSIFKAPHLPLK
jgi:O-antigen ligase